MTIKSGNTNGANHVPSPETDSTSTTSSPGPTRTDTARNWIPKMPYPFRKNADRTERNDIANRFKHVKNDPKQTKAMMDELIKHAKNQTPAERKALIPDSKTMQEVLKEMLTSDVPPSGKERLHAAVAAHLEDQLVLRDSPVSGVRLTNFSHIRTFETVVPHHFTPGSLDDIKKTLIKDSLAHSKNPTHPEPCHVFTLDQLQNKKPPLVDPNLPDPTPADSIHGRDLAGNAVVGLHGGHPGMPEMMQSLHTGRMSFSLPHGGSGWEHSAWVLAMQHADPDKLAEHLRASAKADEKLEALGAKIEQIRKAAWIFKKALQDAGRKKGASAQKEMQDAINIMLAGNKHELTALTDLLLSGKKTLHDEPLVHEEKVEDRTRVMSLMSALGMPCLLVGQDHPGARRKLPHDILFHSNSKSMMRHADAAFKASSSRKEAGFFREQIRETPALVIGPDGEFSVLLNLPDDGVQEQPQGEDIKPEKENAPEPGTDAKTKSADEVKTESPKPDEFDSEDESENVDGAEKPTIPLLPKTPRQATDEKVHLDDALPSSPKPPTTQ